MTPDRPHPRATPAAPRSLAVKLLLALGIGCSGFLLLCVGLVAAGLIWVLRPGRQVPTDAIVGLDPVGVLRVKRLDDDPGVAAALAQLAKEIALAQEERAQEHTPRWLRRFQSHEGPPPFLLEMLLPRELTIVFERLPEDDELHVVMAINFRWFVRPFKLAFESGGGRGGELRHAGQRILQGEDGDGVFCFAGGTFLAAADVLAMKAALDRLAAHDRRAPPPLPDRLPPMAAGWDAAGFLVEGGGDLEAALEHLPLSRRQERWCARLLEGEFELVTLAVDWETADRIRGEIRIHATDELELEDWIESIEASLAELAESASEAGLRLSTSVELDRRRILVDLSLDGLEGWIAELVRRL